LFTDIEGSTRLARAAGSVWADVLAAHHDILRGAIERHGGYVDGIEGDAFFATFADARAAIDAAAQAQRALRTRAWPDGLGPLLVRMGLHTGFVERRELGYVSIEVHRAARVAAAAHGGQILVTAPTSALLREDVELEDLGDHRLKDFPRPERLFNVVVDGRRATAFGPLRTAEARPTNLPEDLTPLLGRDRELEDLRALLEGGTRFVTLVGAGGVGKTRLALALARHLLDDLPGGAFVVPLASVADPDGVLPAVARALGLGDDAGELPGRLATRLADRPSLLVLDNFEQLLPGGPAVAELLERAEPLRALVTSQAPLRVRGETVVALDALDPEAAVALFVGRARAAVARWSPGPGDTEVIAAVCERVGRLPLAVELAAARVAVLSPAELLVRLEASSDVLRSAARDAPTRHRSLRATFEWSHGLLEAEHRVLFRRMGVFAGPVPMHAVEAVAGAADARATTALDALEGLVDFSLVRRVESPAHGWRFTMPQALRDFARDELAASGEEDAVRRRHAEHVLGVARACRVWFAIPEAQQSRLLAVDAETRPALRWAAEHDFPLYRRLVAELGLGLVRRGHAGELIEHATRAAEGASEPLDATGAWLANCHAYALLMAGSLDEAEAVLRPAIEFSRQAEHARDLGLVLHTACWIGESKGQPRALDVARESLALLRSTGDPLLERRGLIALVQTMIDLGHMAEAEETIDASRELIGRDEVALATWRGDIALLRGDPEAAVPHYAASLEMAAREGDRVQTINDSNCLTAALLRAGHAEAGLEAAGAVAALMADAGHGHGGYNERYGFDEAVAAARQAGGPEGAAAYARGRELGPAERVPRLLALARAPRRDHPPAARVGRTARRA
ncbi:MAG TPA: adenylate/guanylate cyclase domain-containing protein, partial [Solirubrobacteraceae bacterium]|nr:adenylate/guanylate cyclase domain-containing protein [Solirubrobacteraceae bacterium]